MRSSPALAPDQLLLEAGDQPARPELEQLVAAVAAFERLAVDAADVVDHHVVAVLGRALHGLERREPVAQAARSRRRSAPRRPGARAGRPRGPCTRRAWRAGRTPISIENCERLPLGRQLAGTSSSGSPTGAIPALVDRVRVPAPERAPQRLVEDRLAAEPADHDRRRHLALAEAGHAHLAAELARGLLDAALDLLGRDLRLDAHARLGQLGDACLDAGGHGDRARR